MSQGCGGISERMEAMCRIIGACLIIAGSTGIGLWYRNRFYRALWHLRYMQQILELFMSEIRYGKATLPECCRQIGQKAEEPYKNALLTIHKEMESRNQGFYEKWREQMEQALLEVPVSKEEKEFFLGFSAGCGLSDNKMQIRAIEQYRDMLVCAVKNRERDLEKQGRMAAGLGIMSGLLLAVILI